MKQINNLINKKFILNNVSQVSIFAKYFNISENEIIECIDTNKLMTSPVRTDPHPSAGFRYNNKSMLKMRDFGDYFWGDCFDAVAYVLSMNGNKLSARNKDDFKYILLHIASTFNIVNGVNIDTTDIPTLALKVKKDKKIITFSPREWDTNDSKIWIQKYYNLFDFKFLSNCYVYPVELYWINSYDQPEPKYYYTRKDPCYAYYLGQDANDVSNINLYFPSRSHDVRKPKFITNNNSFQGVLNISTDYDFVVLCKSYKDAIALKRLFDIFSFTGTPNILFIAYPSENYIINDDVVNWLLSKLKEPDIDNIINFVDFDRTGRKNTYRAYNEYGIKYVFLTNGMFGLPNYGSKDITDFIEKYGVKAAFSIINELINTYYGERFNTKESYNEKTSPF